MRRKSTRNASKSTPEQPVEPRRSSRTSARLKKSPRKYRNESEDDESENFQQVSKEPTNEKSTTEDKTENSITSTQEEKVEEKIDDDLEKSVQHETSDKNVSPQTELSTGNEEPVNDDVSDEKGKSKGISKTEVEEKTEITMNSNASGSTEDTITDNSNNVEPEVNEPQKESMNDVSLIEIDKSEKSSLETDKIESVTDKNEPNIDEEKSSQEKIPEEQSEKHESESENVECKEEKSEQSEVITEDPEPQSANVEKSCDIKNDKGEETEDQAEEGEIVGSKSDDENETQNAERKVKKTPIKIKLRRDSLIESIEQHDEPLLKKIKWNTDEHECLKNSLFEIFTLGVEDFKALSSDLKLADEKEIRLEEIYPKPPIRERTISTTNSDAEKPEYTKQSSVISSDEQENSNLIGLNRKISIVDDSASKLKPPPSPAKQPVSSILYISNLVRPFTLKQLRELLERTGKIKEDGFWTDRIKSKCYVQYELIEEAEATRNALHGVNWPIGNGKKLVIDYATEEDMEKARNPPKELAPAPPTPLPAAPSVTPPRAKTPQKENKELTTSDARNGERQHEDHRRRRDTDRDKERVRPSTREWDIGKEKFRERSRSRSRERKRKHSGRRSVTPLEDFIARKQRKLEEAVPQKLMDDLFQRTKTMPCIYWQPLSPEEILIKQQQRLTRMEEHKRRLEENSRGDQRNNTNNTRGGREPAGRGAYRRRYD